MVVITVARMIGVTAQVVLEAPLGCKCLARVGVVMAMSLKDLATASQALLGPVSVPQKCVYFFKWALR